MRGPLVLILFAAIALLRSAAIVAAADAPARSKPDRLPYPYVWGKAYHVRPDTHNHESGYFSLCEGLDGRIYVGTAKYGENAYLVEFDPKTGKQTIVIDTNAACGLSAKGYAAQAKIHTRNFVGPLTGRIYVGSKQGYPIEGDTQPYPGGYVMAYDPRVGRAYNLGMPFKTEGVIDVTVDEKRGVVYVVTCEQQHWVRGDLKEDGPGGKGDGTPRVENYHEIGPLLARYATTLLGADGCAYAMTADLRLARYDPSEDRITIRPIDVAEHGRFAPGGREIVPTWVLAPDGKRAYLILMDDPTLLEIPLAAGPEGESVKAVSHGKMLEGKGPDSRGALTLHPNGRVYALVRENNDTGFNSPDGLYLHHLTRFDPNATTIEDLGVIAVRNPDFFDFSPRPPDNKPPPYCNGYYKLPDGVLTPQHVHMALAAAHDGTLYATFLGPFTLLRIEGYKLPAGGPAQLPAPQSATKKFLDLALATCDRAERNLADITRSAETVADRYLAGGGFAFPFGAKQPAAVEMWGRSGGMMDLEFKNNRNDSTLVAYHARPPDDQLAELKRLRERGCYVVGMGPREAAGLSDVVAACDAWIDTGVLDASSRAAENLSDVVHGWCFTAEVVSAMTRRGRMPTMWKSFFWDDGKAWAERYSGKRLHEDLTVPPIAPGELARRYLDRIRYLVRRFQLTQVEKLDEAARLVAAERAAGRKTVVAWSGHLGYGTPPPFVGPWSTATELAPGHEPTREAFRKSTPDGALVLRLGDQGRDPAEAELMRSKHQRVIHCAGDHPTAAFRNAAENDVTVHIDLGFAFGDACTAVDGYPFRLFPPSAVMQLVVFGAIEDALSLGPHRPHETKRRLH